jgi:hypothetical protein
MYLRQPSGLRGGQSRTSRAGSCAPGRYLVWVQGIDAEYRQSLKLRGTWSLNNTAWSGPDLVCYCRYMPTPFDDATLQMALVGF